MFYTVECVYIEYGQCDYGCNWLIWHQKAHSIAVHIPCAGCAVIVHTCSGWISNCLIKINVKHHICIWHLYENNQFLCLCTWMARWCELNGWNLQNEWIKAMIIVALLYICVKCLLPVLRYGFHINYYFEW